MLRRLIALLFIGTVCCTLTACCSEQYPPVTKSTAGNPVEAAGKSGGDAFSAKLAD
jgi:hypothetical protein